MTHQIKRQCQCEYEDLFQLGCCGLTKAIARFDATRNVAFTSFAVPYIKGEMLHYLRDRSTMVRVPRTWHETYSKLKNVADATEIEQAATLGIPVEQVKAIKQAIHCRTVTKELPIHLLDSKSGFTSDLSFLKKQVNNQIRSLKLALPLISSKEEKYIEMIYFENRSYCYVAKKMGLKERSVKQLVQGALQQLIALISQADDSGMLY